MAAESEEQEQMLAELTAQFEVVSRGKINEVVCRFAADKEVLSFADKQEIVKELTALQRQLERIWEPLAEEKHTFANALLKAIEDRIDVIATTSIGMGWLWLAAKLHEGGSLSSVFPAYLVAICFLFTAGKIGKVDELMVGVYEEIEELGRFLAFLTNEAPESSEYASIMVAMAGFRG